MTDCGRAPAVPVRGSRGARGGRRHGSPAAWASPPCSPSCSARSSRRSSTRSGVVADDALGLTPVVFLLAGGFFVITMATYVEGNSLHPERGGASTFARYAFDEFWSFVAGWAILLDYVIVMALAAVAISDYLSAFWGEFQGGAEEVLISAAAVVFVVGAQRARAVGGPPAHGSEAVARRHRAPGGRLGGGVHPVLRPRVRVRHRGAGAAARPGRTRCSPPCSPPAR